MHARGHDDGAATRRPQRRLLALLVACTVAVFLAPAVVAPATAARPARSVATACTGVPSHPQATARRLQTVVLAQAHGLLLTGRPAALRDRAAPTLESLDETQTAGLGALPARNVFLRGADCAWSGGTSRFASPVTLTFSLPKALFRATSLPVYRHDGAGWKRLDGRALVGEVNTTASATITRPGRYALLLTRAWKVVAEPGEDLVEYTGDTPPTAIMDPAVQATGSTADPAVIAATMEAASCTRDQAVGTLRSFDSAAAPVRVVSLRVPAVMERYWSGTSSVGRWLSPSGDSPLSPADARRTYALPASNTGTNVTLHLVRRGVALIVGVCADMRDVSGYGPWATGGGQQYFGPKVSTYPPPLYDPAAITTLADLRWEKDAVDAIQW